MPTHLRIFLTCLNLVHVWNAENSFRQVTMAGFFMGSLYPLYFYYQPRSFCGWDEYELFLHYHCLVVMNDLYYFLLMKIVHTLSTYENGTHAFYLWKWYTHFLLRKMMHTLFMKKGLGLFSVNWHSIHNTMLKLE